MVNAKIFITWIGLSCMGLIASAQGQPAGGAARNKVQRLVEETAHGKLLRNAEFGVLAVKVGGDTVAAWNCDTRMLPASNLKLVTTGAALHKLGPDFKYSTRLGYSGTIDNGVLKGDLYIVGGGDPTIASKDSIAIPRFFLFSQWKGLLDKAGIKKIEGRVIGDGRYFDGPIENDTWAWQDVGNSDGSGFNGLSFYENVQDMDVSAGAKVGDAVSVKVKFPVTPWMKYGLFGTTGPAGSGDNLYFYPSEYVPYGEVRGSFAVDRQPKTEEFANKFGAYTCAQYFCNYLKSKDFEVTGGAADVRAGRIRTDLSSQEYGPYASKVDGLTMIGGTQSPSLKAIAKETNFKSDNFYAETLLRTLGRQMHHSASYDSSLVALKDVLDDLGVKTDEVQIRDGSGLSRHNYISPAFMVSFLKAMMSSPTFSEFIGTVGVAGGSHYSSRLAGERPEVRERVHLKSGSMNGVRCFSGYIEPSEGSKGSVIIFSIMTNNALVPASKIDPLLDRIMAGLAAEN